MRRIAGLLCCLLTAAGARPPEIPFEKKTIDLGASEGAAIVDINRDGKLDIVSGEVWYEAPLWKPHKFRELNFENNYVDDFSDLAMDVDGDGWPDVITPTWFAKKITWFKNPGKAGSAWQELPLENGFNTEFAFLVDIDNDGKAREVLPQFGNVPAPMAWYEYSNGKWVKHAISDKSYGHGIGAGDVNGDGRTDVLTPKGWFEAPADPRTGSWTVHADWDFKEHLSFMHVMDVNGDGRADVIAGNAHDYGLFWLDQSAGWKKNWIDQFWSQVHPITIVDLNGDGKKDILTGKRFLAHDIDPGAREPNGIYWYEQVAGPRGATAWMRHIIDYSTRTGAGMQLPVADIDGDGDLDFVAPGKGGLFLFVNKTR